MAREPLDVARLLARRYPGTASISYIPALAWVHTLRLAEIDGDPSLAAKVLEQVRPWLSEDRPLFGDRISFAAIAGTMAFSEIAGAPGADRDTAARLAAEGVALGRRRRPRPASLGTHPAGATTSSWERSPPSAPAIRTGSPPPSGLAKTHAARPPATERPLPPRRRRPHCLGPRQRLRARSASPSC